MIRVILYILGLAFVWWMGYSQGRSEELERHISFVENCNQTMRQTFGLPVSVIQATPTTVEDVK